MRRYLSLAALLPVAGVIALATPGGTALAATGGGSPTAASSTLTPANDPACYLANSKIKHAVIGVPMRVPLDVEPEPQYDMPGAYACAWFPKGHRDRDRVGHLFIQQGQHAWRTYREMLRFPGTKALRCSAPGARYSVNAYFNGIAWWPLGHRVSELSGTRGHGRAVARGLKALYNKRR